METGGDKGRGARLSKEKKKRKDRKGRRRAGDEEAEEVSRGRGQEETKKHRRVNEGRARTKMIPRNVAHLRRHRKPRLERSGLGAHVLLVCFRSTYGVVRRRTQARKRKKV